MAAAIFGMALALTAGGGIARAGVTGTGAVSARLGSESPSAASDAASARSWPHSIVVLGHSGATGQNSDPAHPGVDVPQNSWATGTNPAVDSVYLRILARNPAVRGHAVNLAQDGATVEDLVAQARRALAVSPRPDLFLIQTIDNDIRCDGSDPQHYAAFGAALTVTLQIIARNAPRARIFLVTQPGTVANNAAVAATNPEWVAGWQGTGPCDAFDPAGNLSPTHIANLQDITDHYFAAQAASCSQFWNCSTDNNAWQRMVVTAADFSSDGNHPSIAGMAKRAAVTWAAMRMARILPCSR